MIQNIKQKVNNEVMKAVTAEKEKMKGELDKFDELSKELKSEREQNRNLQDHLNEKEAVINKYKQHLRQLAQENPDNLDLAEKMRDIENFKEDRIPNAQKLQKLVIIDGSPLINAFEFELP